MATRSLVASTDVSESKPTLQRTPTDNYTRAATAATQTGSLPATTASSVAASVTDRPGMPRQQSWKMSDFKGRQQGLMVEGKAGGLGYSSTGTGGK